MSAMIEKKDKFDEKLFAMATRERMVTPESVQERIEDILCRLPEERRQSGLLREEQRRNGRSGSFHMNWKKAFVLAAACVMLFSMTATAAVSVYRQRMEAMNREKIEAYFAQIYQTKVSHDSYSRPLTEMEQERMEKLNVSYETEGLFPEKELTMLERAVDYKGKGVGFVGDTSTFCLPEKEMSDEELLQIIDFRHKRDYSLEKMNAHVAAGEAQIPAKEEPEITPSAENILTSPAVYAPEQELVIPYTGNLEMNLIAAGRDCLFLAGYGAVHKMDIGGSDSRLFFDDFGEGVETRILSLCEDTEGNVYMGLWQWTDDINDRKMAIWVVSREGELLKKIDMADFTTSEHVGILGKMVVDQHGQLYVRMTGRGESKRHADSSLIVLDKEGNFVTEILSEEYGGNRLGGLCVGKDGRVYTQIESLTGIKGLGIASVNVEKGCLEDIHFGIVPEDTVMLDIVTPGANTDFVFWGYDGIFTYDLGDESAVCVLPVAEAPCEWENIMNCALPDGRVVFAACREYRFEKAAWGEKMLTVPDKICFYYQPVQTYQE